MCFPNHKKKSTKQLFRLQGLRLSFYRFIGAVQLRQDKQWVALIHAQVSYSVKNQQYSTQLYLME